jgi:hypothetical protein
MKAWEVLLTLIIFSVSLIVYYSMFGSVVTSITGAVSNWTCAGGTITNVTSNACTGGTNMSWLPGILIILAAIMPLFALIVVLYAEMTGKVGSGLHEYH